MFIAAAPAILSRLYQTLQGQGAAPAQTATTQAPTPTSATSTAPPTVAQAAATLSTDLQSLLLSVQSTLDGASGAAPSGATAQAGQPNPTPTASPQAGAHHHHHHHHAGGPADPSVAQQAHLTQATDPSAALLTA